MIRSMTGFGEGEGVTPAGRLRVELRTVNHRYLNVNTRLPTALARWEEQVPQSPLPDGIQDKIGFPSRLLSTQILHTLALLDGPPPVPEATKLRVRELEAEWARMRAEAAQLRRRATADLGSASRAGAAAR